MLLLARKAGQSLVIDGNVRVTVIASGVEWCD